MLTSIKTVRFKAAVFLNDQVSGISLQPLGQRAIVGWLGFKVSLGEDFVTKGILGGKSTGATSGTRGDEEGNVWDTDGSNSEGSGSDQNEVHQESTFFVDVQFLRGGHVDGNNGTRGNLSGGKGSGRTGRNEGKENRQELHGCSVCEYKKGDVKVSLAQYD